MLLGDQHDARRRRLDRLGGMRRGGPKGDVCGAKEVGIGETKGDRLADG